MENDKFYLEYRKSLVLQKTMFEAQLHEINEKIAEIDRKTEHK